MNQTEEKIMQVLTRITGSSELRANPDISLFEEGLLDSLGFVELIVELSEILNIDIPPSEVERGDWETPRKIISFFESRLA